MVTPYMLHLIKKGRLPDLTSIDLTDYFEDQMERKERESLTQEARQALAEELNKLA